MNLKKTLPFFSYLFHPIFISVYATLFYFFYNNTYFTDPEKYFSLLQVVIITIALPLLFYFLLKTSGKVDSMMVADVSQRKIPLVIQLFLIIILLKNSITVEHYLELHFFFLAGLLSTVTALILLFFKTKASLHMMTISALTLFVMGLSIHTQTRNVYLITFLVLMNGFVAASRLEMKAHSGMELVIGFFVGIIPQIVLMYVWL